MHDGGPSRGLHPAVCLQHDPYDSARNKTGQPLPPIYPPEVAAEGIRFAAYAGRREACIGAPAVKAIRGNTLAPWAADQKLRSGGFEGQLIDQRVEPRPDHLFDTVEGPAGAHGRFDHRSRSRGLQLQWTMHCNWLLLPMVAMTAAGAPGAWARRD